MQPISVFLPGEFHRQRSLVGYSPWGRKELDMTKQPIQCALKYFTICMGLPQCGRESLRRPSQDHTTIIRCEYNTQVL